MLTQSEQYELDELRGIIDNLLGANRSIKLIGLAISDENKSSCDGQIYRRYMSLFGREENERFKR